MIEPLSIGSLEVGDELSKLRAAPMEVHLLGMAGRWTFLLQPLPPHDTQTYVQGLAGGG